MIPFYGWDETEAAIGKSESAYGGTGDIGIRYVFENGVAATLAFRAQAFHGGPTGDFAAWGPLVAMTVPFSF